MFVFGFAYIGILTLALKRHDEEESAPEASKA
jgi:hypothetical protein